MTGPLDAWFYARDRSSTQLVQVAIEGDSTFAGQTLSGDPYSPVTRLREVLAGAGLTDGGHGIFNGYLDTYTVSGEPLDAGVTAEPSWNITNGGNLKSNYAGSSTVPGAVYTAKVYGQRVYIPFARYGSTTVVDITIDGTTERITVPVMGTSGGTDDSNWQTGFRYYKTGLTYGLHTVTVTLVSGRLSCLIGGTRNVGVVLNNFAARAEPAVVVPYHQMQSWAGLVPTNTGPVVPTTVDTAPGSLATVLGIYNKGINDQQGNNGVDTSDAYYAKAYDFGRAFRTYGKSAIICSPWWESANQAQLAPQYRAASIAAAANSGALWLDLGPDGALAGHMAENLGGTSSNPHLTALAYRYQGDYLAASLLAGYSGTPGIPGLIPGRTITGYRIGGIARELVQVRRPG